MEDQLTKAAVKRAVKGVVENLGPFLKYLEELITGYFYRKEKKRKELAEVFASHLDDFAHLLAKSADKLEKGKGVPEECGMLQALAWGLDEKVLAKVLKDKAKREKIRRQAKGVRGAHKGVCRGNARPLPEPPANIRGAEPIPAMSRNKRSILVKITLSYSIVPKSHNMFSRLS